jgi:phospholipase/carboxylesterase
METTKIGPLTVRALGPSGGHGPAILLCHGFGAPGDDLVGLARAVHIGGDVDPGVRWFFPEAPIALDWGGGRAWWPIDILRMQQLHLRGQADQLRSETPPGLAPAREALEGVLAALERDHGVDRSRLVIGGFSQGAMLATEVALAAEVPFAGLAILSGTLISADRWAAAASARGASIHALVSHGRRDPLLPFEDAERLRALLEQGGATVTWVPHGGQHEIPAVVVERLTAFARRRLVDGA